MHFRIFGKLFQVKHLLLCEYVMLVLDVCVSVDVGSFVSLDGLCDIGDERCRIVHLKGCNMLYLFNCVLN